MPRLRASLSLAPLFLAFALSAGAAEPATTIITPDGLGPVKIGMSKDEALKVLGAGWKYQGEQEAEAGKPDYCGTVYEEATMAADKWSVSYMIEEGKLTRVSVGPDSPAGIASEKGIHIGSTEDDVRKAYGDAVMASPHQYEEAPAQYLTVWTVGAPKTPDGDVTDANARGIRFVTDKDKKVVEILSGSASIQYIEGCA